VGPGLAEDVVDAPVVVLEGVVVVEVVVPGVDVVEVVDPGNVA
jgi:hypothetical protein